MAGLLRLSARVSFSFLAKVKGPRVNVLGPLAKGLLFFMPLVSPVPPVLDPSASGKKP